MSEPDFERLRRAAPPQGSDVRRQAALDAAMAAFDDEQAKKAAGRLKGTPPGDRHTSASPSWAWRMMMQNRMVLGGAAACLVAAPIAAILAMQNGLAPRPESAGGQGASRVEIAARPQEPARAPSEAAPDLSAAQERATPQRDASAPPPPMAGRRAIEGFATSPAPATPTLEGARPAPQDGSRDRFVDAAPGGLKIVAQEPVSTFSIDADTASYAWTRRSLLQGRLPGPDEVRVEELINYFPYDYARPESVETPFRPTVAVTPTPWSRDTRIVHIGIKGFQTPAAARPKANLVFLVDVSGSMSAPDKLPLVKTSLKLLLDRLAPDDHVAIVTYAGGAGVALTPTKAADKRAIVAAIDGLASGGATAGAAGIQAAYGLARQNFDAEGINRVMLATDGDFNVGLSDDASLQRLVEAERKSGVFLSVLGFGQGNYNDALMQRLAQNGNGTAAYIDQLEEAQKVLAEETASTLFPIAKDVKIQVEFNPAQVSEYRLIGYETRALSRADFNDDRVDAGEVGSGAAVTALYEITPVGSPARLADDLRYVAPARADADRATGPAEYGFLKLRYKRPREDESRLITQPISEAGQPATLGAASDDVRFAAAVAAFGQKLKDARELSALSFDEIAALADGARGADPYGYRAGFVRLVRLAKAVSPN